MLPRNQFIALRGQKLNGNQRITEHRFRNASSALPLVRFSPSTLFEVTNVLNVSDRSWRFPTHDALFTES